MTDYFYRTHTWKFFQDKNGVMLRTIKNNGGDIRKGSIVGLCKRQRGLEVISKRRKSDGCIKSITKVNPKDVDLIES